MKRFAVIFLALTILVSQSGFSVSMHWCGGKLASVKFFSSKKLTCGCGEKGIKSGCCKDKTIILKADDCESRIQTAGIKFNTPDFAVKHLLVTYVFRSQVFTPSFKKQFSDPPPLLSEFPVHLKYRVLLI